MNINESSRREQWNASYSRGENNILYPQTEVVRFLNRYVAKRTSLSDVEKVITGKHGKIRCLDFACGVGTHAIVCDDFGIESYGVDISQVAIDKARKNATISGCEALGKRLSLITNDQQKLDFEDNFFDVTLAESCLDSMPYAVARKYFAELRRVTTGYIYFSVISARGDNREVGEEIVSGQHEKDTVQTYFDVELIQDLTSSDMDDFLMLKEVSELDVKNSQLSGARFYCVLKANEK